MLSKLSITITIVLFTLSIAAIIGAILVMTLVKSPKTQNQEPTRVTTNILHTGTNKIQSKYIIGTILLVLGISLLFAAIIYVDSVRKTTKILPNLYKIREVTRMNKDEI